MLVLTRKLNESIIIQDNIEICVVNVDRDRVKIGIQAPKEISIHRAEIYDKIKNSDLTNVSK